MDLTVTLTQDQYDRYQAAFKKLHNMDENPTDEQLIAQLKREASAITFAVERGSDTTTPWAF